jgi:formylglycine-generating enzyme required for sulfatase activity
MRAGRIALLAVVLTAGACARPVADASGAFRDCRDCPAMVALPPGAFLMGAEGGEPGRPEGPVRDVRIAYRFALGLYEVTQAEFARFVEATGRAMPGGCQVWDGTQWQFPAWADWRDPGYGRPPRADEPVACVNWEDARDYAAWLAKRTGKPYRLPSEAEWEYAARAGTTTPFPWGDAADAPCRAGNVYDVSGAAANGFGWDSFDCDDGHGRVAPVGRFAANAFGLHDVLGNLWEWTADCYVPGYDDVAVDGRPFGRDGCERYSVRGGSWITRPGRQHVSFRGRDPPQARYSFFGFRVARDL